ncbi:hypothetical protein LSUB1_G008834 [Lachnellula subtilissima]|uniref:Uncharacterized protein n=1 Tax=Lachnellula subtilissima TaxID=602034 RepID=A0A8H8U5M1_9HELO|nr:hypothetical protein LSUB1_G008834 [Lachnellula subtilissima]
MNEALCSILCGENEWLVNQVQPGWYWRVMVPLQFQLFHRRRARMEEHRAPNRSTQITSPTSSLTHTKPPQLLGQLTLEITLVKQIPQHARAFLSQSTILNELGLTDAAFRPKSYTIRIEKGNFVEPCCIRGMSPSMPRFALLLLFDTSPYPPRVEWRAPEGGPDSNCFWEHRKFVGRDAPELRKSGRAMHDFLSEGWKSCVVS